MNDAPAKNRLAETSARDRARAHLFVMEALEKVMGALDEPRHISGLELSEGVRDLALERFGLMARTVLEQWGIYATDDVGRVVFEMIERGLLVRQEGDEEEDFSDLFDFEQVFETEYPWSGARQADPEAA